MTDRIKNAFAECLETYRLSEAMELMNEHPKVIDSTQIETNLTLLNGKIKQAKSKGQPGEAKRLKRYQRMLNNLYHHGPVLEKIIPKTELEKGYRGKILLLSIAGRNTEPVICLRSGDDWHYLILKNTENEFREFGLENLTVTPLGGAIVSFELNGDIILFGSSDEYGVCDKTIAAKLIKEEYPQSKVIVR